MKGKKDEWYLPWVIRLDPLKTSPMLTNRFGSDDLYESSTCTNANNRSPQMARISGPKVHNGDMLSSLVSGLRSSSPIERSISQSMSLHNGLLRINSGGCKHRCHPSTKRTTSLLKGVKCNLHNNTKSFDLDVKRNVKADEEKVIKGSSSSFEDFFQEPLQDKPSCPRKVSNLRQAESLDDVFDNCSGGRNSNELGDGNEISVSNARSLPHMNQLSDYEDDLENKSQQIQPQSPNVFEASQPKRNIKKKKTNLRRRHATREKDGRSKSLTQIDSLVNSSEIVFRSQREKFAMDEGDRKEQFNKLGIPEEPSTRRPMLSMENRISSGEFVTVVVDCGKDQYEEIMLAIRGLSLKEALEVRGLETAGVDVYEEGQRSPISLHTDTWQLAGKYIHVRARDDNKIPLRYRSSNITKKTSGGRFWGSSSTEEYIPLVDEKTIVGSQEGSLKASKSSKVNNRWSLFQSNSKDSNMDDLAKQLNFYSRCGIPKLPHLLVCQSMGDDHELKIEEDWRRIVSVTHILSECEEKQQSAIWELVETEATYISMLKVITDLFLACLCNLQNEKILNEIDTDRLFNNIQDIYEANLNFWRSHVFPVLEETRRTKKPLDPTPLLEGFYKFEEIFQPYTQYCLEQSSCQSYCKYYSRENNHFKAYLAWCETQKECNRLKLVDILVQPMQRLTKYSLLLKAIHKKTQDENHKSCLLEMVCVVDSFVSTVNSALRNRYEQERLKELNKNIESYDAVETRDDELAAVVKHHSDLNLMQPMPGCPQNFQRWLLFHGDYRFRDAQTSKIDVHIYLFTDLFLVTKITQKKNNKVKVVRPPFRIDRLVIAELKDSSMIGFIYLSDWGVAAAAFTLQSSDLKSIKLLLERISSARKQYQDAKYSKERPFFDYLEDGSSHLPRSPRLGSSRTSRVSSLAHSHSGSIELNETSSYVSPGGPHPPSMDLNEIRASSASSEDSLSGHQSEIQRSKSLEGQQNGNSPNRRIPFPKTPNTLSVTPPYSTGQSLPNLSSDPSNSLKVPTHKQMYACNRGISYPPPSPRTLRRCPPVPQSRNPPLLKTRHVTSIASIHPQEVTSYEANREEIDDAKRRLSRGDRLDNRRYHTAGAIDDLKKQDTKDTTIHKRLSLNYGKPPISPCRQDLLPEQSIPLLSEHKTERQSASNESVHSSSGVSSTSSQLRAEYEALENIDDDNEFEEADGTVIDLPVRDSGGSKLSSHISTTYICHDSDVTLGVNASQYITQPLADSHILVANADVSKSDAARASSVQITVNRERTKALAVNDLQRSLRSFSSSYSSSTSNSASAKSSSSHSVHSQIPKDDQMKDILLSDANIEASDV